jgi:hypothetical protein
MKAGFDCSYAFIYGRAGQIPEALGQDRCGSSLPINRYFFCFADRKFGSNRPISGDGNCTVGSNPTLSVPCRCGRFSILHYPLHYPCSGAGHPAASSVGFIPRRSRSGFGTARHGAVARLIKIEEIVMELGFAFLAIVLFIGLWLQT